MKILKLRRKTLESDIEIKINFFGFGFYKIKTFNFFLDHMLSQLFNYSLIDIYVLCFSDFKTDYHHLLEDLGITLGILIKNIKKKRYNSYFICMDDCFIIMTIDFCERIFYIDNLYIYDCDIQLLKEFIISFVKKTKCNLQLYVLNFYNKHHLIECFFKLLGILLNFSKLKNNYLSTKGML